MSRAPRQPLPRTPGGEPEPMEAQEVATPVEGIVAGGEQARTGEDARKRGWFWHWNAIVTQFAPLVGLKGVGLLNSYTVWTDRREESPHRGYAFPSQQSEADFYGEDRSELITINKILVALDLIEIRKEMVLRVDEQGRRWRVPHNLYRVKDRDDGFVLTADAVDRVVQLAAKDKAVYRYIRHIFSPRFRPIDANNVWTSILESITGTPTWELLAARAAQEDARASARTKAGHRSRKSARVTAVDTKAPAVTDNDSEPVKTEELGETIVATTNKGLEADVAPANKGSGGSVERTNRGSTKKSRTSVAASNPGQPSDVALTNTTYHQELTTTTTREEGKTISDEPAEIPTDALIGETVAVQQSYGPGDREAPVDRAAQEAALRNFHDANHREATIAERKLLRDLAERFEPAARSCPLPGMQSGWQWVAAAIVDAVDAGSAYVAPRRVREILLRWEREGPPGIDLARGVEQEPPYTLGPNRNVMLPHGRDSGSTWAYVAMQLGMAIERERLAELVDGTAITGFVEDDIVLEARDAAQAGRLTGEYRALVVRKLSEAMRRPVGLRVEVREASGARSAAPSRRQAVRTGPQPFTVPETGLTSTQLWAAVLDDVQRQGKIGRANVEAWLRPAALIDVQDGGVFVIGAPNSTTRRRIADRFAPAITEALSDLTGERCQIDVVLTQEWVPADREGEPPAEISA